MNEARLEEWLQVYFVVLDDDGRKIYDVRINKHQTEKCHVKYIVGLLNSCDKFFKRI